MSNQKNLPNKASVEAFLNSLQDEKQITDSFQLFKLMQEITGEPPKMWGGTMIGFGSYHYKYQSGREGDYFLTGFSSRKGKLSIYIMSGFTSREDLMGRLGKYKTGKSCLYVKSLEDIDLGVLRQLVKDSVAHMKKEYDS